MSYDIQYPNLSDSTDAGMLKQIRGYLYQLADQLNWALNTIEKGITENIVVQQGSKVASGDAETPSNFNELKSLIIKSADVVEAFEEEFSKVFDGKYVAQSGFGEYMQRPYMKFFPTDSRCLPMIRKESWRHRLYLMWPDTLHIRGKRTSRRLGRLLAMW